MPNFLIYCEHSNASRLQYVLDWILKQRLFATYEITKHKNVFQDYDGPKINYSKSVFQNALNIIPTSLLFEQTICTQKLAIQRWKKTSVLFYNQPKAEIPFDLFSAVFYLISRYEEYLPHQKDKHGRFSADVSVAMIYRFLDRPVVDEWISFFSNILVQKFKITFKNPKFKILHTFDIDIGWKYLFKGAKRTVLASLNDLIRFKWKTTLERYQVLFRKKQDPYYSFPLLQKINLQNNIDPLFFFLLGNLSTYDRNANPMCEGMIQLMNTLSAHHQCGIHPSYGSHHSKNQLKKEIEILSETLKKPIFSSRQHYIKFSMPETFRTLIALGIKEDYSMGYPSVNGFRAGTSFPFLWYDLKAEKTSELIIHPFVFMDATCTFYLKKNAEEAYRTWRYYYNVIQATNGHFISIWHNFIINPDYEKGKWLNLYQEITEIKSE